MSLFWPTYYLSSLLYPVPDLPHQREKELKVICLGLPRSGTDSLHNALKILKYDEVSHGFQWWANVPHASKLWIKLALDKRNMDARALRTKYFDRLLSDCEATTDIPAAWFAPELLTAYPKAKVILNRRRDAKAWKESFRGSVLPMLTGWEWWSWSWFQSDIFWMMWLTLSQHGALLKWDFEKYAEEAYVEHYERLEAALKTEGREYLNWSVEDGWKPLCEFLEKPIPNVDFPKGNTMAEFGPRAAATGKQRTDAAKRNLLIVATIAVATISCGAYWFWTS